MYRREEMKETEINPDDFMDFPVMQRMVIEMMRLAVRVILALPDMLLGHYFSYPINCGWGLNRTRANVFFSEKFFVVPRIGQSRNLKKRDPRLRTGWKQISGTGTGTDYIFIQNRDFKQSRLCLEFNNTSKMILIGKH